MNQIKQKYSVAIIGAGVGRDHALAFADLDSKFDLKYICDLNLDRATELASEFKGCLPITDFSDVLADPDVDIIDICLPPHLHFPTAMKSLDAGKHVICEKPFMMSMDDTQKVAARAKETGLLAIPVFQYRYGNGYRRLIELMRKGLAGKPFVMSLETHWERDAEYYSVPWRGTWSGEMGGAIVSHAVHIHNLATHCLGNAVSVAAMMDTLVNDIETEDSGAISFRMKSGALVTSSFTLGAAGDMSRMRICFEHLTAESDLPPYMIGGGNWTFTAKDPAKQAQIDAAIVGFDDEPVRYNGLFADVYAALRGETDLYLPNLEEAQHSAELITAIYESSREGKFVALPLAKDHPMHAGWIPGD